MADCIDFVSELEWRGMIQDIMPGTRDHLLQGSVRGYVGIDPTAESLHIGHLVSVMMLKHLQRCGHEPVVVLGGATGLIGDPSGKSEERNLLSAETLEKNMAGIRAQLERLLGEGSGFLILNNYDWIGRYSFIDFIRDIGKHITVNYMMGKDSVRRRLSGESGSAGMSFTEFTYQLIQGADFLHLRRDYGVELQLGGSDQWGNITTGAELVRRIDGAEVFCLTCPLVTKADGTKFGKTESGNVWLSAELTSPYRFYQFWLNTSDDGAERYIRIYTFLSREEIDAAIKEHRKDPGRRHLQRLLAESVTDMVHGEEARRGAESASQILFGRDTAEALRSLDGKTFLDVFEGVPQWDISSASLRGGIDVLTLLADISGVYPSRSEARRAIQGGGLSINKERVEDVDRVIGLDALLNGSYILVQKGKREFHLLHTLGGGEES